MDDLKITCELSPFYKDRLNKIIKEKRLTNSQVLEYLLDCYYLDNATHLTTLYKQLSQRLYQGVDRGFIIQLRIIYTAIGHFLKRLRYI
jgi:hypothetical protein